MISRFQISRSIVTQLQLGISERQEKCISLPPLLPSFFLSLSCLYRSVSLHQESWRERRPLHGVAPLPPTVCVVCVCVCVCGWLNKSDKQPRTGTGSTFLHKERNSKRKDPDHKHAIEIWWFFQWPCSDKLWMHDDRQLNAASIPPPLSLSLSLSCAILNVKLVLSNPATNRIPSHHAVPLRIRRSSARCSTPNHWGAVCGGGSGEHRHMKNMTEYQWGDKSPAPKISLKTSLSSIILQFNTPSRIPFRYSFITQWPLEQNYFKQFHVASDWTEGTIEAETFEIER